MILNSQDLRVHDTVSHLQICQRILDKLINGINDINEISNILYNKFVI